MRTTRSRVVLRHARIKGGILAALLFWDDVLKVVWIEWELPGPCRLFNPGEENAMGVAEARVAESVFEEHAGFIEAALLPGIVNTAIKR